MGTTTSLPFAWFDEPLEHLDPQLRHAVAATLATATRGDSPRQLLVITYEHDIAQQLADVLTAGRTTISVDYCAGPVRPQERPGRTGSNARGEKIAKLPEGSDETPTDAEIRRNRRSPDTTDPLPKGPFAPNAFPALPCSASLDCPEYNRWPEPLQFPASFLAGLCTFVWCRRGRR